MKRHICIVQGHKWEMFYRGNNMICGRCEKVVPLTKWYTTLFRRLWPKP